jgi:S-formylglutathione hydrolase FrmB
MARLQFDTGFPNFAADFIVPEYARNAKAHGKTRSEYCKERSLPVLWLLHGFGGNASDWPRYSQIEVFAEEKGLVVVCPSAENGCYVNMAKGNGWEDLILDNMWATVHAMLPTSDKPEDNFIAGAGIGGYGAVKYGLSPRPKRFSRIGSFSGELELPQEYADSKCSLPGIYDVFGDPATVLGGGDDLYQLADNLKADGREMPKIWLSAGKADKRLYDANGRYRAKLEDLGFEVVWDGDDGADAGWLSLNKQLGRFIETLPL